ncbi:Hypothetical predicted protein [Podarcis lilfordi]|uniref:Uncharacterized protein n=1 Tax=Podarcis lilfordi TaxID=74358 RepID=A0AA35P325_9SAUR|nr:Hypothetical predicted protein [Podarcis lilfordi]
MLSVCRIPGLVTTTSLRESRNNAGSYELPSHMQLLPRLLQHQRRRGSSSTSPRRILRLETCHCGDDAISEVTALFVEAHTDMRAVYKEKWMW